MGRRLKFASIFALGVLLLAPLTNRLMAQELRILTSFPESFYTPFKAEFERAHPGAQLRILNKNTNAGLDEILRGNPRGFDIFWASSPEAFALLTDARSGGALRAEPQVFALAGMGWAYRTDMIAPPSARDDLLNARFSDQIAITRPARSGTNHMFVEQILQRKGWVDGWAFLLELAANLTAVTPRSFTSVEGVADGRFRLGISIDYLSVSNVLGGLEFSYGKDPILTGARIAELKGGQSPALATRFTEFVLSETGQEMLLRPDINRIPILPKVQAKAFKALPAEVRQALKHPNVSAYDAHVSARRYWATNALFDAFITFPLERRKALWARVRHAEALGLDTTKARAFLTAMPIEPDAANTDPSLPLTLTRFTALSAQQQERTADWSARANQLLDAAADALDQTDSEAR